MPSPTDSTPLPQPVWTRPEKVLCQADASRVVIKGFGGKGINHVTLHVTGLQMSCSASTHSSVHGTSPAGQRLLSAETPASPA